MNYKFKFWGLLILFVITFGGGLYYRIEQLKLLKENAELKQIIEISKNPCIIVIDNLPNLEEESWSQYSILDTCFKKVLLRVYDK